MMGGAFLLPFGAASAADQEIKSPPKGAVPIPMAVYNFDHDVPGQLPKHFTFAVTGQGPEIHWEVRDDPRPPSPPYVLAQSGRADPGENFALALLEGANLEQGEVAVRFKAIEAEDEQAAGIVWRYKDPNTYYVVCASAREDTCGVYRVKNGKRKLLDEESVTLMPYVWHDLHIIFVKKNYSVFVDGQLIVGGKDASLLDAGEVGLWTKADSSIRFDDFRVSR